MRTFIEILTEGRGLSARAPGEKFADAQGNEITFQGLQFFPERGHFQNSMEMMQAAENTGLNIHWTNKPKGGTDGATEAFGIATFTIGDDTEKKYYLGRYFKTIDPNRMNNNFPHEAIPGGFKLQSGLGKKEGAGYKPSEILTNFKSNTPDTIAQQIIAKFGQGSDEANAVTAFMSATQFPIKVPKGNMNVQAFRDYFCEMLQPVALVRGMPIKGNAQEAAEIFFGSGAGYNDCVISFNEGVSGGLFDSLLVNSEGKQIKLSSKGKSGANASVVNLLRCIEELQVAPKGAVLLKKYAKTVEILSTIDKGGHAGAPLQLGVEFGIITNADASAIMTLKAFGPEDSIPWGKGTEKIQALYKARKARDPSKIIPFEHALAAVAYKVADYVNNNTDFGKAASDILNHSALVQMYTDVTEAGNQLSINGFTAVYPSETVTGVLLDAAKAYMSTQGKGNFVFQILKNGAKPVKQTEPEAESPIAAPNAVTGKRIDIRPQGAPTPREPRGAPTAGLGRERR